MRTSNHNSGNLITNLARLCELPLSYDEQGLKIIRGVVPCYVDGYNYTVYIFRMSSNLVSIGHNLYKYFNKRYRLRKAA